MSDTRVVHEIVIDTGDSEKDLKKMQDGAKKTDDSIEKTNKNTANLSKTMTNMAKVGVASATAIGVGIYKLGKDFMETTDNIDKMSQKIGLSTQGFQEWDFILSQSGANVDSLQTGMKTLLTNVDGLSTGSSKATEAFGQLGLSMSDLEGMGQEELFEQVVTSLQGVEDETQRATIANQLLGKSGSELAPLLNAGIGSIDAMKQEAHELGLVLDDETIQSGVNLTDTFDKVTKAFETTVTEASAQLVPTLEWVADVVMKHAIPAISTFAEWLAEMPQWIEENSNWLKILGGIVGAFVGILTLYNVTMGIVSAVTTVWTAITTVATVTATAFSSAIAFITSPIGLVIGAIVALVGIIILLVKNWDKVKEVTVKTWETIKKSISSALDWIGKKVSSFGKWILDTWSGIWQKAVNMFKSIMGGLNNIFKGIVNTAIVNPINSALKGMNALIKGANKIPGVNFPTIPNIPKLEKGTNMVLQDGLAYLHKGEQVVPATVMQGGYTSTVNKSVGFRDIIVNVPNKVDNVNQIVDAINLRLGELL